MTSDPRAPYVDPALYDLAYSWYDADLAFYLATARASRGPVLEAACGTGRVLLPALAAAVDIDGFDLESAMLDRLRSKADAQGLAPRVVTGDLRDFTMPRRYDLVMIPFRAFMHLHTTADQVRALRCIREHLEPGGTLVMNVFYPSFDLVIARDGRRAREQRFAHPGTGLPVELWDLPRYDRVNQTVVVEREVIERDATEAAVRTHRYGFTLRWTFRFEMELLLAAAGFARWDVRGGFDGRPFERDTDEMVWTAWKD